MSPLKRFLEGRFMNHPLHPMLVHLPVGLWVASLIFDIVYLVNGNANMAVVSFYCMLVGIIGAAIAAVPGLFEYLQIPANTRPKSIATAHMVINVIVLGLYVINYVIRDRMMEGAPIAVTTPQFVLSLVSFAMLGVSGYLGGLLVYDHGIGFKPQTRDRHDLEEEVRRVA